MADDSGFHRCTGIGKPRTLVLLPQQHNSVSGALLPTEDGYDFVVFDNTEVVIFRLDKSLAVVDRLTVSLELESAVGVHRNQTGDYFIAFIQDNTTESTTQEVIRLVKYNADWIRQSATSVRGGAISATRPVDFGNLQMADNGIYLVIHTSRERFVSSDGLNHQSNLTLIFHMNDLELTYRSSFSPSNHVSHSFNQRVLYDGDRLVTIDHGDAYPRSIVLQVSDHLLNNVRECDLLEIRGEIGDNYTGVTMGDLVQTATHYMMSYSSINQKSQFDSPYEGLAPLPHIPDQRQIKLDGRNAYLALIPREDLHKSNVTTIQLTHIPDGSNQYYAGAPQLVYLTNNRIAVLWELYHSSEYVSTQYVVMDAEGNYMGDVQTCSQRPTVSLSITR